MTRPNKPIQNDRQLNIEKLEERCVLSANGLEFAPDAAPDETMVVAEAKLDQSKVVQANELATDIRSISLRINGQVTTVKPSDQPLNLAEGDVVEVVDVAFESNAEEGIFAVEAYINKINSETNASLIDYNDGRFSMIESNYTADGSGGSVDGLAGSWKIESGWDRLTINLMHYTDNDVDVASRMLLNLQVGKADFAFDKAGFEGMNAADFVVGEEFDIEAAWGNLGSGVFHNYAEVDVYHASDPEKIIWAGALVGNASGDNLVKGQFVNTRADDGFSEKFVPDQSGEYIFKFYLDPEGVVAESDESNNQYQIKLTAQEKNNAPEANFDSVTARANQALDKIDVLANDVDADQDELSVAEFTQAEHGKVALNQDGTFAYKPEADFVGTDKFQYSVTDGQATSDWVTVAVDVLPDSFAVTSEAVGQEDTPIPLDIRASSEQFSHVRVSNVPATAKLSHGHEVSSGNFHVKVADLDQLTVTPPAHSDAGFELAVTPFKEQAAYVDLTESINVQVEAVADGGRVAVPNFAIFAGTQAKLPVKFDFPDLDQSEQHKVTFSGMPDMVGLTVGKQVAGDWVLDYDDLQDLRIKTSTVTDFSGFTKSSSYYYKRFDVKVTVESIENSNKDRAVQTSGFSFYLVQSRRS